MALTKQRKSELLKEMEQKFKTSAAAVFAEFDKVTVGELTRLRRELKKTGAELKVVKKSLLDLLVKKNNISFDPFALKSQLGAIFSKGDVHSVAALIQKFSKEVAKGKVGNFSVAGAYDAQDKRFVDSNEFKVLAALPSREILLAQIAMMLTMPIKQLMNVINERAKSARGGSPEHLKGVLGSA